MATFAQQGEDSKLSTIVLMEHNSHLEAQDSWKSSICLSRVVPRVLCFIIFTFSLIGYWFSYERASTSMPAAFETGCQTLFLRREWRSLSALQQKAYLEAVKCLATRPSSIRSDQTRYDDFPYAHRYWGISSHNSALFLPWHRQFLHIYHESLRTECNYSGPLTYWDWSLDWRDLTKSPIWDNETGFGGDGSHECQADIADISSRPNREVVKGGCVNGFFADLQVKWQGPFWGPHYLRRGFDVNATKSIAHLISPGKVSALMQIRRYETFNKKLEEGPHDIIPGTINGDFAILTAPNDPVFFLHHVQLDRLWWLWQSRDWENRGSQYNGLSSAKSNATASLHDLIDMGRLGPSVTVSQVIDIRENLLCYDY